MCDAWLELKLDVYQGVKKIPACECAVVIALFLCNFAFQI